MGRAGTRRWWRRGDLHPKASSVGHHSAAPPAPTVTKTITITPTPKPDDVPLTDHLQGWGTVAAVIAALLIALFTGVLEGRRRRKDQEEGEKQREQDRADADRRLHEERAAADRRLQQQLNEQRDRDHRQFIAEQLQKAALHWSKGEIHQLPGVLAAIPDQYATIIRYLVRGEDYHDVAGFPPLSDVTQEALRQQLTGRGLEYHGAEQYLVDKIQEQVRKLAKEGKGSSWVQMNPWARELYRVGYDYKKVQRAWLYEEIGENIAEVLARAERKL